MADKVSGKAVQNEVDSNQRVLNPALKNLNAAHAKRLEDCGDEEEDARYSKTAILDPSGTVYEAIPSNTLEGVTATVYEVDPETSAPADQAWDAEAYEQVNPQTTGVDGVFGWDVPSGTWQVKFEKDGYETTTTDPLVVPPPRTGLKVGMVATAGPEVLGVTADTSCVEIVFSQWMDTASNCSVTVNGAESSQLTWIDTESVEAEDGTNKNYGKVLQVPLPDGAKAGDSLSVIVEGAKNYAGKDLSRQVFGSVVVAPRPTTLVFNFEDTICLQAGTARATSVRVYDADGNPMEGVRLTATIDNAYLATVDDSNAVTNAEGVAKLPIEALLPGMSTLSVAVEDSALTRDIALLTSVDGNRVARPTAKIGSTTIGEGDAAETNLTVDAGTTLELATSVDGATIYYATDGSCPCQNGSTRQVYTGPITLSENTNFIIAAYKDGMDYSERLRINVTVRPSIAAATVKLSATSYTYTGKAQKPVPTVTMDGATLVLGTDYTVTYKNNVNAGTATAIIKGTGAFCGTKSANFKINKAAQTITAGNKTVAVGKKVKLGAKTTGNGKLTYKSGNTAIVKVNAAGVLIPVKPGAAKVTITAAATANYNKATKTVTVKVVKGTQVITASNKECVIKKTVKLAATRVGNGKLTYKSSNAKVATVSAKGVVTGKKVGTVRITITAAETTKYKKATKTVTVKVGKANTLGAKSKKATIVAKYATLKSKAVTLASNVAVSKPVGTVVYANASTNATAKKFKVNAKTGNVTVPKGTKAGKYPVVLKVKAAGNKTTISGTKTVKFYVQVK